jgi:hypothetical protein
LADTIYIYLSYHNSLTTTILQVSL